MHISKTCSCFQRENDDVSCAAMILVNGRAFLLHPALNIYAAFQIGKKSLFNGNSEHIAAFQLELQARVELNEPCSSVYQVMQ